MARWVGMGVVAMTLLAAGAGCGARHDSAQQAVHRLVVAVTLAPQAEFVERVGGRFVEPLIMVPPGAEPHTYEPTPQQLVALSSAQAYAEVGSGLAFEDMWMKRIRDVNPRLYIIDCGRHVSKVAGDPHIWLSLRNARTMADAIRAGLTHLDSAHAAVYRRNFEAYAAQLSALDEEMARQIRKAGLHRFLVYHPSWGYLARDYGLEQISVEDEGKAPTGQSLARLIQTARATGIGAVFVAPEFDTRSARAVAAEIHAPVLTVDPLPRHYLDEMRRFAGMLVPGSK